MVLMGLNNHSMKVSKEHSIYLTYSAHKTQIIGLSPGIFVCNVLSVLQKTNAKLSVLLTRQTIGAYQNLLLSQFSGGSYCQQNNGVVS